MKHIKQTLLALGLAGATTLFLTGCGEGSHAGHDHSHGGDAHSTMAEAAGDAVSAALQVIEKPTAEQIAAAKPYSPETCAISDEKLGEMGEPIVLVVGKQQVKLCCESCIDDVKKDPAKVLAKLTK